MRTLRACSFGFCMPLQLPSSMLMRHLRSFIISIFRSSFFISAEGHYGWFAVDRHSWCSLRQAAMILLCRLLSQKLFEDNKHLDTPLTLPRNEYPKQVRQSMAIGISQNVVISMGIPGGRSICAHIKSYVIIYFWAYFWHDPLFQGSIESVPTQRYRG